MRLFLTALIFDMVFHSLAALAPYREWFEEWDIDRLPRRLPTLEEIAKLAKKTGPDNPSPVADRVWSSLDSVWGYFKPWPPQELRHKLESWEDRGKYALCWLTSRLDFFEGLAGMPQRWTMFSPNASRGATVARFRLLYRDGTCRVHRLLADPEDLTHYSHWFEEKILDCELKVPRDWDSRWGYCNYLSHRFRSNSRGSPLKSIYIYDIYYDYPAPDADAEAELRDQNGPPDWDKDGPRHVYETATKEMHRLRDKQERLRVQKDLAQCGP
jgi:hypothetical protein